MGHPTLHPPCNPDTPAICLETPRPLSGISGLRAGLSRSLKLNPQLHIKINLRLNKKLNQYNMKLKFLIQEFIKISKRIIP
jgi:hypothetical protein